ncbi:MAG: MATE family efflux transporter [Prevotella sp.]|nr:MATE family efflux transporter [Staphylococcus sp.]MCM1350262.1 MATE family efflux transporter [Prevotella sp.]
MKNTTEQLEKGKILPLIFRLTLPAVIAQLITFLYNIVDRMYVSAIQESGMEALAALGIVLPITLIIQAFANLIGLGGSPRASMKLGENHPVEANHIFNTAFMLLFMIGSIISLITFFFAREIVILFGCPLASVDFATSYLQIYSGGTLFVIFTQGLNPFITAQGYALTAMLSVLIGAIVNIILDPIFIFTLGMGVNGASLATVLSQLISFIWIMLFFLSKKSIFRFRILEMKWNFKRIISILSLGISPFIMTLTECAIQIVFNLNLKWSTGGNQDYTAALTIMLSALQLISLPLNGLGYGMQPFVSYNYGKGNAKRLKEGIRYITFIAFLFAIIVWSISLTIPQVYAYMFSASDTVEDIVRSYTPYFLMGSIMFFVQMTLQNINVALGQSLSALFLAVLRKVIILIPLCFLLTHWMGYQGVYLSEGIADFIAGIITTIVIFVSFPRVFKKREAEVNQANQCSN